MNVGIVLISSATLLEDAAGLEDAGFTEADLYTVDDGLRAARIAAALRAYVRARSDFPAALYGAVDHGPVS